MTPPSRPSTARGPASVRGIAAWCFYDWANSSFAAVILTFVFAAYFTKAVAADPVSGTQQWGYAVSLSALAVALLSPVLGAIADRAGRRKPWLAAFTALAVAATAALWFARPDPSWIWVALIAAGVGNFAFEMGQVFYNAMLPDIAARDRVGRVSGWGWGVGYAGGVVCLGVALVGFVQTETPWFGVTKDAAGHIRAVALLVAVWFGLFSLPLFLFTPDTPSRNLGLGQAVRGGLRTLAGTLSKLENRRQLGLFLLARMLYIDGLTTLFAFGGIYAAGTFGLSFTDLIVFGIALNVTAGIGAAAFAWFDDRWGAKATILISVVGLSVLGTALLVVETETLFWAFGLPLGIFVGPAQSASRSFMARIAPADMRTEMFGLLALSGKATAFVGPAVLATVTAAFNSQRAGMATIIAFFVAGAAVLVFVRDADGPSAPREGVAGTMD